MAETYYAVKFGAKGSGKEYLGQKDVFPVEFASFADGFRCYGGDCDLKGATKFSSSYFKLHHGNTAHIDQALINDLSAYTRKLVTTGAQPDIITLYKIVTDNDPGNYKVFSSIEHSHAQIGKEDEDVFRIVSPEATLSTIPEGGEQPTEKTKLDFVNYRVNGK